MGRWYHILRFFLAGLSPATSDARVDGRTKNMVEIYLKNKIIYDQQEEKNFNGRGCVMADAKRSGVSDSTKLR